MKHRPYRIMSIALSFLAVQSNSFAAADNNDAVELSEVQVVGQAAPEGSARVGYRVDKIYLGPLGAARLQDTPFTVNTVSADLIKNTQATNATEALKYVPTVYSNTGSSQVTPYFTMRGFSASTWTFNMAVDGMRSFDIYQPMDDKERIEVMSGATSFLYGITSVAGMINYVTKQPTTTPYHEVTVGTYGGQLYSQLDLGGPVGTSRDVTYRLNLAYADPGVTSVDHQTQERYVFSGALDWRISPDTKLALDTAWSKRQIEYASAQFVTTAAIGIPKAGDASKNWGAPYTGATDATTRVGAALESKLNDVFTLRTQVRHSDIEREYAMNRVLFQSTKLNYKWRVDSQQKFDTIVDQYALFLDAGFDSGPLKHKVTLGATLDDYDSGDTGSRSQTFATVYPASLYGTPSYPAYVLPTAANSTSQKTRYNTFLLADQIAIGDQWALMLGETLAQVNDAVTTRTPAGLRSTASYGTSKSTPAVSISFKPIPSVTTYLSYVEALQQGFTAGAGTANVGQVFAPYVGKQKEAGVKASVGGLSLNLARFEIEQANQYVDPVSLIASQDGRAIHKGWEFSASGKASERLTITGGFTSLDARIDKATTNVGNTPQGAPEHMAKIYAEYDLPPVPGLILTGGASYTGKVPWDNTDTLYVDAVTVVDAGLRYQNKMYGKDTTWRLNAANLTGKDYWTTRNGYLYLGNPRTLSLSASLAF